MKMIYPKAHTFTNIIPRRRDKYGNPIGRKHVSTPPIASQDAEALSALAETSKEDPEQAKRHMPWLLSVSAIACAENAKAIEQDEIDALNARNDERKQVIEKLSPLVKELKVEERDLATDLAESVAPFGQSVASVQGGLNIESSLPTLEEIAGEHNLAAPEEKLSGLYGWFHRYIAICGGGSLLGLGLGLLTGTLELTYIEEQVPALVLFLMLGMAISYMIGAALMPLSIGAGEGLTRMGMSNPKLKFLLPLVHIVMLIGLAISFIVIESKVEQLGIFRGLVESTSLTSELLTKSELLWVSLTLVLPLVSSYIVLGLIEGSRRANLCKLLAIRAECRKKLLEDVRLPKAARLQVEHSSVAGELSELASKISATENSIEQELPPRAKDRLENAQMDATGHAWAAQEALMKAGGDERSWLPRRKARGAP